ncbi:hypothetical protein SLEP1_g26702 [Rubroshorea leprosula]|uniref:U3 small nucleolar RNA-associated protein 6 N-terminal domain-containing protein n=1 Tax=Rubroshorea leprosula TaxID=152421 RepID=A0AAV5JMY5_9ROSI|nr:hypothetical protein SLEP1_g26702 [Rubroshorea leprosula]
MADVVHYRLEHMTNELDDLEWRRLFTRREIAEIVKWRRKFEYQLKRPSPLKQDYIAYIDYESRLDDLRRLRKKAAANIWAGGDEVLAQVIRFHPKVPGVWIYAVGSEDLWIEYLRMELTYLNKLKASKVALGVDKGNSSSRLKEYC